MKASDLRAISIKNNPDVDVLTEIYKKMGDAANVGKTEYRHFPDELPEHVVRELKKNGYKVKATKGEYETTDTLITWQ